MKQAIVSGASEMGLSNRISVRLNPNLNSVKLSAVYLFNLFALNCSPRLVVYC